MTLAGTTGLEPATYGFGALACTSLEPLICIRPLKMGLPPLPPRLLFLSAHYSKFIVLTR